MCRRQSAGKGSSGVFPWWMHLRARQRKRRPPTRAAQRSPEVWAEVAEVECGGRRSIVTRHRPSAPGTLAARQRCFAELQLRGDSRHAYGAPRTDPTTGATHVLTGTSRAWAAAEKAAHTAIECWRPSAPRTMHIRPDPRATAARAHAAAR